MARKRKLGVAEKVELAKHMKNIVDAQTFFCKLEQKYEGDAEGPPEGPFGEAAENLSNISIEMSEFTK